MSWNYRSYPKFKDTKKTTEKKWKKEDFENGSYFSEFMKDWEECRNRHDGQQIVIDAFFDDGYQYIFNKAGRKFAKTTTDIDIAWRYANEKPNRVVYFCYPTIALGIEVIWEEERLQKCDRRDDMMMKNWVSKVDNNKHIVKFKNGSYMKLVGTWSEAKGRGTQPDLLIVDEIQDCDSKYLDAMDPNLAAKDGRCVMSGTPPRKRNHWYEWWDRIHENPRGKTFHFTSYDNRSLPHLEEWLDRKKKELLKAGKEDEWLREYMAEDCFSNADRVLPDVELKSEAEIMGLLSNFAFADKIPILAISMQGKYLCSLLAVLIRRKSMFVLDHQTYLQIWNKPFSEIFPEIQSKCKSVEDLCGNQIRHIVWDPTKSFQDCVKGFSACRTDLKWQDRGIPLLRELMLNGKIHFSEKIGEYGLECQNLLRDETIKDVEKNYPLACTSAMLVNEFFSSEKQSISKQNHNDKYQALREMGIPCPPPKKGKRTIWSCGF